MKARAKRKLPKSLSAEEEQAIIELIPILRMQVRRARRSLRSALARADSVLAELRAGRQRRRKAHSKP
jgi:hypothetical protein